MSDYELKAGDLLKTSYNDIFFIVVDTDTVTPDQRDNQHDDCKTTILFNGKIHNILSRALINEVNHETHTLIQRLNQELSK